MGCKEIDKKMLNDELEGILKDRSWPWNRQNAWNRHSLYL